MTQVEVRLSELRSASGTLRQASYRLQLALDAVLPIIDQSLMDALPVSENAYLYQSHKAHLSTIPAQVTQFADNLEHAADDIALALDKQGEHKLNPDHIVHFYAPKKFDLKGKTTIGMLVGNQGVSEPDNRVTLTLDEYVSKRNQPLYDELKIKQSLLKDRQSALALLMNQRNEVSQDLTALRNRIISFDGTVSADNHPRITGLELQLKDLDQHIATTQGEIDSLQLDVDTMNQRLHRVAPSAGAELDAIIDLEGAQNPQWLKSSTFGCVSHIVDKMPLPNGIARDALLWDDAALELPQYGISWGDTPLEGSVLQMEPSHPYADNQYGHVLYVERVENGVVWVTDNLNPDEPVKLTDLTTVTSGSNMRYLYFPWNTKA